MSATSPTDRSPSGGPRLMTFSDALRGHPGDTLAAAYEQTRVSILRILSGVENSQLMSVIPACPEWTVRDLVAHMAGVASDTIGGRFPAINPHGTWLERQAVVDAFTASQVASRENMNMDEVLSEWGALVPQLLAILRGEQPLPAGSLPAHDWVVVSDIAAHGQDLRGTFHIPGDRDSAGVSLGLQRYVAGVGQRLDAAGLPALTLCAEDHAYLAGSRSPAASVTASRWELFRALGGRRSPPQLRELEWAGDPDPYVSLMPAYAAPVDDLIE
jgi:uncharacterized protein (TIGR03083 family)